MIVRIVRLSIKPEHADEFYRLFRETYTAIRGFEGCSELQLFHDADDENLFITYSHWESEEHLNEYRQSDLFKTTWAAVKPLFSNAPQAFSMKHLYPTTNN